MRGGGDDVAAAGVDLVFEDEGDGLPGGRALLGAFVRNDFLNRANYARWTDANTVTGLDRSAGDASGEPAEVRVGPVNPLHRPRKGLCNLILAARNGLAPIQTCR